jgi:hypothetical protein
VNPHPSAAERDAAAATERAMMARDIADLKQEVADLRDDIKGLVTAWNNANFGVSVIKWLAGIIMAGSALVYVVTHFGQSR